MNTYKRKKYIQKRNNNILFTCKNIKQENKISGGDGQESVQVCFFSPQQSLTFVLINFFFAKKAIS